VKPAAKQAKKDRILTPKTFALLEAADLADRCDRVIKPALQAGCIVVADRWVCTAFARGMGRAIDAAWLRAIYSFAPMPDVYVQLALPPQIALDRIRKDRPVKFYEAGMDLGLSEDPDASFLEFQSQLAAAYTGIHLAEDCFTVIDAQASAEDQHHAIIETLEAALL
jgi:dTMP kinase